ncbi:MAG: ATP-binding cassette domain-containing protein [Planctomycetota bacterium]
MTKTIEQISWPVSHVGEALGGLCRQSGLLRAGSKPNLLGIESGPAADQNLDGWLEQAAGTLGVEAEPVEASYGQLETLVSGASPALLRLQGDGQDRFLVLLGHKRHKLRILSPDGTIVHLAPQLVQSALSRKAESSIEPTVQQMLEQADIGPRRRQRTRDALMQQLLASDRIAGGWLIRVSPSAGFLTQARELHLLRLLGSLLAAHTIYFGLWIVSWWLLGSMILQGHLDFGWLLAWILVLITLIPFRILVTYIGGLLGVRGGALLKRLLLFRALKLEPDQVRRQGPGQLLGRVLEAEVLDSMALTGGFLSFTAVIELLLAGVVLGCGAGGVGHILLLVVAVLAALLLGRRHYRRRRQWTDRRLGMTDDLVERMEGHRTRLAQEPRQRWNREEDGMLESYLGLSAGLDRTIQSFKVLIPRGWFMAGMLGLAPVFVFAGPSPASLGIALGGILIAYSALRTLTEGLERVAAAAIAWDRIELFWQKAAKEEPSAAFAPACISGGAEPTNGKTLLEAQKLTFRYPRSGEAVLEDINLKIRTGDQLLLEGASGGGKTTLAALLATLRDPESGMLLSRGLDRQTLGETAWRRRIIMAPQFHENHVLTGTLAFNLLMGRCWPPRPEDLEEARGVCESLGMGPLLERMPAGLEQIVGECGWQLSHGERSRLYLARALLQGGDMLILDESLGALDPETLQTTLGYVLDKAPTLMMIAHP